jgi:hypothetical protein
LLGSTVPAGQQVGFGPSAPQQQPNSFAPGVNPKPKKSKKKRPVQQDQSSSVQGQPRQGFGGDLQGQVPFGQAVQGQEFIQQIFRCLSLCHNSRGFPCLFRSPMALSSRVSSCPSFCLSSWGLHRLSHSSSSSIFSHSLRWCLQF